MTTYTSSGNAYIGIWVQKSGTWTKIYSASAPATVGGWTSGGNKTMSYDVTFAVDCGTGPQAFGVTYDGTDSVSATLTAFVSVSWAVAVPSTTRTASIGGTSKSTITVIPQ